LSRAFLLAERLLRRVDRCVPVGGVALPAAAVSASVCMPSATGGAGAITAGATTGTAVAGTIDSTGDPCDQSTTLSAVCANST